MKLSFNMSISDRSSSYTHTPVLGAMLPFRVEAFGHFFAEEPYFTEREGKDSYLFIYTADGKGLYRGQNRELALTAGDALLIDCRREHFYGTFSGNSNWELYWIHFNGPSAAAYYDLMYPDGHSVVHLPEYRPAEDFERMSLLLNNPPVYDVYASQWVSSLLTDLYRGRQQEQTGETVIRRAEVQKALDYIALHYSQKLTIEDITKDIYLNTYHFLHMFKKHVGQSLYDYLLHYRLNRACRLLTETDLTVREIAARTGFSDTAHFIRMFKKHQGITPGRYRAE